MVTAKFNRGDLVVYCKTKHSTHPGPRASNVSPAAHGDTYNYTVDKYWTVVDVLDNGELLLRTRRGKQHVIKANDPSLRRASLLERWFRKQRFPELHDAADACQSGDRN